MFTVGELRKELEGWPDSTPVVVEKEFWVHVKGTHGEDGAFVISPGRLWIEGNK